MKTGLFDLSGRVAIVTGGNGGIGLGMASGLAEAGAAVAIVGRNEAKSAAAVAEFKQRGAKAISVTADVTDKSAVAAMVERVRRELGRIDILVNNAGINIRKPPQALDIEEWDRVIGTNQRVPVLAGGLSDDESRRRRQDHKHRLDDVDLRRQLRAGLRREQRRHRAVHALLRVRLGRRQHPGQRRAAGLDRHRSDQAGTTGDRWPA
jgi:NAD(P)-dependent dehydrogenase (short-subunit alcohol dehydrogenase family)